MRVSFLALPLSASFLSFSYQAYASPQSFGLAVVSPRVHSIAWGLSEDGSTVSGYSYGSSPEAFRWTSEGGMVGLGDLSGGDFFSVAIDTSADGSAIVGYSKGASGFEAFLWRS